MRYRRLPPGAENARRCQRIGRLLALLLPAAAEPWALAADAPARYETIVRAPNRAELPREDTSASASVITSDRTARSGETLPQLLSELPGVVITRYGSQGSLATVSLRGSSPNQVAAYADGAPLDSAVTGSVDLGLIPLTAAQRIEVYRGSSPLGHGSSAIGGVLSLTSEAPARSGLSAHTGLGSFATRLGGGELAWVEGRASVVARLALLDTAADFPYRSDNRTLYDPGDDRTFRRQNNQLGQLDGALRAAMALGEHGRLWLSVSALSRQQGLPARGTDQSFAASLQRRRLVASLNVASGRGPTSATYLRGTGYLLLGEQRLSDPLGEVSFVGRQTRDRSATAGASVTGGGQLVRWLVLSGLLDVRHEGFFPREEIRPDRRPPGRRELASAALAGTARITALALDLTATVRGEAALDRVSPDDLFGGSPAAAAPTSRFLPIARLGLLQTPHPALRLRANLGSYARLPTLFERYGNGGLVQGNPALLPERGLSGDLGGSYRLARPGGRLLLDAALFTAAARELIHFEQMGYFAGYLNVAQSRSVGLELAASARLGGKVHLTAQTTAMDVRDRSGHSGREGRQLPHQPRVRAYLRPELRALPVTRTLQAGLYADAELTGARYQDPANLVRLPARLVLGAGADLAYRPAGLRAIVSGYNLHDARSADVLEFPLPGRSFFVTLQFSYPSPDGDPRTEPLDE